MNEILEVVMLAAIIASISIIIYRLVRGKSANPAIDRITAITMGIGFVAGVAKEAAITPVRWIFILYAIGAMLCYTAVLLSIPEKVKKKKDDIRDE